MAQEEDLRIKDLPNTATEFANDDVLIVDGNTNGTRRMSKDTLLSLTAQTALAGKVAPEFVPNSTKTVAGRLYIYNGSLYRAKEAYQGSWNASKFVIATSQDATRLPVQKFVDGIISPYMNSKNWLDTSKIVEGYYINYTTGVISAAENYYYTENYIPVLKGTRYYTHSLASGSQVCYYDIDFNYISGTVIGTLESFVVPQNAVYARFSMSIASLGTAFISLSEDDEYDTYDFGGYEHNVDAIIESLVKDIDSTGDVGFPNSVLLKKDSSIGAVAATHLPVQKYMNGLLAPFMNSKNWLDTSEVVEGKFLKYSDGTESTAANYCYTKKYIPIKKSTRYYFHSFSSGSQVCYYDIDFNFLSGRVINTGGYFTTPSGAYYFRMSQKITDIGTAFISFSDEDSFDAYDFGGYELLGMPPKKIYVAQDGSGDYNTVTAAVAAANSGDTIVIAPGVYDNEIIEASGKVIHLKGSGCWNTIIKNGTNDYRYPTIEMGAGTVEDLQLYMYDGGTPSGHPEGWKGYCIHIDYDLLQDNSVVIDRCILRNVKGTGVGMGTRKGCHVLFRNTQFISEENLAFYMHDSISSKPTGVQDVRFECCTFTTEYSYAIRLTTQGVSGNTVNLTFLQCSFADSNPAPLIEKLTAGSGGSMGNLGLLNFNITPLSYGNNIEELNWPNS